MLILTLVALGVGGSTLLGGFIGFAFKGRGEKLSGLFLSSGAGIMLAASVVSLILPSVEGASCLGFFGSIAAIFAGAAAVSAARPILPFLHCMLRIERNSAADRVLIFVCAIALHNLPEGLAAGVGLAGEGGEAFTLALGIAFQNIPEGMVLISPLLSAGISTFRTLLIASFTGVVEIIGTFLGYFFINLSAAALPLTLAFAGGSMLFVICNEMLPEICRDEGQRGCFFVVGGFCLMLAISFFL